MTDYLSLHGAVENTSSHMTCLPPHLSVRLLTPLDLDQCDALEIAGFPPEHRASRETIAYRLGACPELCMGLFENQDKLVGHVIATKIKGDLIVDDDMGLPTEANPHAGHQPDSRLIGVHLVVVDPACQGQRLGTVLFNRYVQCMRQQDAGNQIVILAKESLAGWYSSRLGFTDYGVSSCTFGNTVWHDLGLQLAPGP